MPDNALLDNVLSFSIISTYTSGSLFLQQYQLIPQQDGIIFAVPSDGNYPTTDDGNYPNADEIEESESATDGINMEAVSTYMQAPPDERVSYILLIESFGSFMILVTYFWVK